MQFGLIFFSSREATPDADKYRLLIESAKFADRHGFSSVWIPERHFTQDGWLYPNPAILQAALARETKRISLRAGSVVMPLHDPIRVAEEWAVVDNISNGRVGISFASGWHPNDFVFFPEKYTNRHEEMYRSIQTVQKLWQGESVWRKGGDGKEVEIRAYPAPIQPKLPTWITAAGNPDTFVKAGEIGAHLLTHMFNQSIEELAEKIRLYRKSLANHGHDAQAGQVTVMFHTFIWENADAVLEQARISFCDYLKSASYLLNAIAYSRGQKIDLSSLSEQDINDYLSFVFDRLISTQRVLFGTPETCFELIRQLRAVGVDEIACQMDFGLDVDLILKSLPFLNQLKERCTTEIFAQLPQVSMPSDIEGISSGGLSNAHTSPQENSNLAQLHPSPAQQNNSLQAIQARCLEEIPVPEFYNRLGQRGIQLDANFQGIEHLWRRDGEALGQVRIPKILEREADFYQIHPAFLDACFQVLIAALPTGTLLNNEESLYLPIGLQSFEVHNRPGTRVWSHAILKSGADQVEGLFEGDIYILDEEGQVMIEACGLQLQRTGTSVQHTTLEDLGNLVYELRWEPTSLEEHLPVEWPDKWLIFMDRSGTGQRMAELLTARGVPYIGVFSGDSYHISQQGYYSINPASAEDVQRLMQDVLGPDKIPCRRVIHLWSLDATPSEETSIASLEADQILGVGSALSFIHALIGAEVTELPRLWLVTRGAQAVGTLSGEQVTEPTPLAVSQSPLWGLGRTCAVEHPELWGGLIDVDPQGTTGETAKHLLDVLSSQTKEDQIAFRRGQAYVARVVRSHNEMKQDLELRSDSSYLITGGLWGLGFEVARWMAKKGVRHLILLGRTKLPQRENWNQELPIEPADPQGRSDSSVAGSHFQVQASSRLARQIAGIRELEELGAHVHYASVDVADEAQLAALLENLQSQGYPPIRGVIHAASVWQDQQGQSLVRPLARLNTAALEEVTRPKMMGAWLLQKLLKDTPLDFFVCFSSAASLFGSAGQGNYAAASAFLDALAHHLRALGKPALSIDWGAVSETGFGATSEGLKVHEYWESHGIHRITPKQVLAALEQLIPQNVSQIGVIKLDWNLLQQFYPQLADLPLVTYLAAEAVGNAARVGATAQRESNIIQTLLAADQKERRQLLEAHFREYVANVLRLPATKLDVQQSLTALGLDSLMAIELKNRVELELGIRIPIVTFLLGPSIAEFTAQVLDQLAEVLSASTTPAETMSGASEAPFNSLTPQNQASQENNGIPIVHQQSAEQFLAELDQLSDEEVDSLLSRMLQEEDGHTGAMDGISRQTAENMLLELDQLSGQEVDSLLSNILQKESDQ